MRHSITNCKTIAILLLLGVHSLFAKMNIGVGLNGIADYGSEIDFINILKMSRWWDSRKLPLTDNKGYDIEEKI